MKNPIQSNPIQSNPIQSNPIQSNPIQSNPGGVNKEAGCVRSTAEEDKLNCGSSGLLRSMLNLRKKKTLKQPACISFSENHTDNFVKILEYCFSSISSSCCDIKELLEMAANIFGAGCAAVWRKSPDGFYLDAEYHICTLSHENNSAKKLPYSEFGDFSFLYNSDNVFFWDGTQDIPQKLEDLFKKRKITAVFQYAVVEQCVFSGFISFSFYMEDVGVLKNKTRELNFVSGILSAAVAKEDAEHRIKYTEAFLCNIMDILPEYVFVVDGDTCGIRYINRAAGQFYDAETGSICKKLNVTMSKCTACPSCPIALNKAFACGEFFHPELDKWLEYSAVQVQWIDGTNVFLVICSDVTLRRRYELELERMAYYDSLINIKNRMSCIKDMEKLCTDIRQRVVSGAILLIDIVGFKYINSTFGQHCGDEILQKIGRYFCTKIFREDVYRIAGDRFLLILRNMTKEQVFVLTGGIYERFSGTWFLEKSSVSCKIWTAVLFYPGLISTPDDIFRALDHTIAYAKKSNAKELVVFDKEQDKCIRRNGYIVHILKEAVKSQTVTAWYQPVYEVSSGRFVKAEALARLIDSDNGMVSPAEFIPLAEQTGSISDIGIYILEQVCRKIAELEQCGIMIECINVNISPVQFMQESFSKRLHEILHKYSINPAKLELEITESVLIASLDRVSRLMRDLALDGIRFALDDFGTGYSSLNYLLELPIDTLKIDRSFICRIENDENSRKMLKNILNLAKDLNIYTIAEGIETEKQFSLVSGLGCTYIQGYYFSRPLQEDDFVKFLMSKKGQRTFV